VNVGKAKGSEKIETSTSTIRQVKAWSKSSLTYWEIKSCNT
jgi:hypothetical protein